jgi:hypothetical protein
MLGVSCRPQGYEPDSAEEFPPEALANGGGEDDRQGRTFGLVKKGYHHIRNMFFGSPPDPYYHNGYAPCGPVAYNQHRPHANLNLPLTPYAL